MDLIPEYKCMAISDKSAYENLISNFESHLSCYTFANFIMWQEPNQWRFFEYNDHLVCFSVKDNNIAFFEPIGSEPWKAMTDLSKDFPTAKFQRISENTALKLEEQIKLKIDLDNSEYLYNSSDLRLLEGRKYDGKRNHIKKIKETGYDYERINPENIAECQDFMNKWIAGKVSQEDFAKEVEAVKKAFRHFNELNLCGGIVRINGKIAAFTFGEIYKDALVVHVEKGDSTYNGVYQVINYEFCNDFGKDLPFINRQQDLGIKGIRKAKESYHPIKLIKTFKSCK